MHRCGNTLKQKFIVTEYLILVLVCDGSLKTESKC